MMTFQSRWREILAELADVGEGVDPAQTETLRQAIRSARRNFADGHGRSGLIVRALAIRLVHLGFAVHVVGEPTTPPIGEGDVFIAASASGKTVSVLTHLRVAHAAGARTAIVTTTGAASLADVADIRIDLPIGATGIQSQQHAGSLFEQACLILFDAVGALLQEDLGLTNAQLTARHANLQ